MAEFLMRMVDDPAFVDRAIAWAANRAAVAIEAMLDAGCDAVYMPVDYCDAHGPMMGPERFRRFIKPALAQGVAAAHERGKFLIKHSDGNQWPILDDFVEVGVDAWHGIQPRIGMDLRLLKERYAGRLCFFGGVNCETLTLGTPAEVEEEAAYAIKHAAPGGGFVLGSGNSLMVGTRYQNYRALLRVRETYGKYPIRR